MKTRTAIHLALAAAAAFASLPAAAPAFAHAEHGRATYGGVVAEAGHFQGELVARPAAVVLFITDHGKPVPTQGAHAKLTVLAGADRTEVALVPAGDNRLEATAGHRIAAGAKAVATVKLADGRSGALRFELK